MAKIYSNTQELNPKQETINFILNYSKALSLVTYNEMEFETILN